MDHGTLILLFNLWALLLALFLMRAYQNRSVRIQMVRTHNRSRIRMHRLRSGYRRFRGRLLMSLGRGLLWLVNRLETSTQPGKKAVPPHMRLLRNLLRAPIGLLPWYFIMCKATGQKPTWLDFGIYLLAYCAYGEIMFQFQRWRERRSGKSPQPAALLPPEPSVAVRKVAEEDST